MVKIKVLSKKFDHSKHASVLSSESRSNNAFASNKSKNVALAKIYMKASMIYDHCDSEEIP